MGILKVLSGMFGVEKTPAKLNYGTMLNGITPISVSYTHLDVYKRQVVFWINWEGIQGSLV